MATVTAGAPAACKPSHTTLAPLEPLPDWAVAPDGCHLREVEPRDFRQMVSALGIKGLDMSLGHVRLVERYIEHLRGIYDRAGRDAVTAWLATRGVLA